MRASCAAIRLFRCIERESRRHLAIAHTPISMVTWDEAALLALIGSANLDFDAIVLWMGRLGVGEATPTLRDALATLSEMLPQMRGSTPITGVNQHAAPHRSQRQMRSRIK